MRRLPMGEIVLQAAIDELARHGNHVDPDLITFWSNLRTVCILISNILNGGADSQNFRLAAEKIRYLFPDEDFSELTRGQMPG